jgi:hypothetical protein
MMVVNMMNVKCFQRDMKNSSGFGNDVEELAILENGVLPDS